MYSITISNGFAGGSTWGGGIHNSGALTLGAVAVVGNRADCGSCSAARGGGILNQGTLNIFESTISNNVVAGSGAFGGGIDNRPGATLTISNSTIAANTAHDDGTYENTVQGGGIYNNSAGTLSIFSSTITGNAAIKSTGPSIGQGGGIKGDVQLMRNTILAKNSASNGPDNSGLILSGDHNWVGGDPRLGPLQNNGGSTKTVALLPDSPAIDAGDNTDAADFDQRGNGFLRIVNGTVDIGAFEVQSTGAPGSGVDGMDLSGVQLSASATTVQPETAAVLRETVHAVVADESADASEVTKSVAPALPAMYDSGVATELSDVLAIAFSPFV
jgi:hypothetical protein